MKTQESNPVFAPYRHLIPNRGRYPVEHVNVFWNETEEGRVKDVEIVFIPRAGFIPIVGEGDKLWKAFGRYVSRWEQDLGNSCEGWMEKDGLNPAQILGHMLRLGFKDQNELIEALVEFSRIEGQSWAFDMLSAFRDEEEVDV